jgi:hypothetical protein
MTDATSSAGDPTIEPDTKDWTWVLERPCPECGFDARAVRPEEVKNRAYANASAWRRVLEQPDAARRPACGPRSSTPATSATCTVCSVNGCG